METTMPVVPYGGYGSGGNDGFGLGGIGGILIGSLLAGNGGLFGRGGWGNGYGGGPAAAAVATDVVLNPAFQSIQTQLTGLQGQVNNNNLSTQIGDASNLISTEIGDLANAIGNLATAQATGNFTTLQSINGLGRDVQAQSNQNALQQLNSFNNLTTTTLTGFNSQAMQTATATNQIIAQGTALSSQLSDCCCTLRETIVNDGNATRALINANKMEDLQTALNEARLAASQAEQTASLINALKK